MKTITLGTLTLGPNFNSHTAESFYDYINELKLQKDLTKVKSEKVPRVKKPKVSHNVDETSLRCVVCNKKPRVKTAICPGVKISLAPVTQSGNT